MTAADPDLMIICPYCPLGEGRPPLLAFHPDEEDVICRRPEHPRHESRYFRLLTRQVAGDVSRRRESVVRTRCQLRTQEAPGRTRMRVFYAPSDMEPPEPGELITFVYQGDQLVGLANQTRGIWQTLIGFTRPGRFDGATKPVLAVALLLAGLLAAQAVLQLARAAAAEPRVWLLIGLFALAAAAPLLRWALAPRRQESFERLPESEH